MSLFFLSLVLVMSSGLTVYTRSCDHGCEKEITLNKESVFCEKEKPKKEREEPKSCCAKTKKKSCETNNEKQDQSDEKCCDVEAFSLDVDFYGFFPSFDLQLHFEYVAINTVNDIAILRYATVQFFNDLPPPDIGICGRTLLLQKNSFLI
ncbi:MAG: hypothetical protein R2799_03770 [Crocinitomicaceae bacterium]